MDSTVSNVLSIMSAVTALPKGANQAADTAKSAENDFQKLLEEKSQAKDSLVEDRPKANSNTSTSTKATAKKAEKAPVQKEDPAEASKQLQVYLVPLTPEELSQIPAAWLPANLEEGEPIVCIGVRTGENGEQVPVLVGANEAAQRFGKEVTAPWQTPVDVSDPEADAMLEATAPGADNSPTALLEEAVNNEAGQVIRQAVEEIQPQAQQEDDDTQVEVTDVEQAPQRIFHDVQAAPVKVGEAYSAEQTDEADVVRQVDNQIAQAVNEGESMVRIQLTPENLGTVTVEISQNADGVLHIALNAHSSETRGILERHAADLQGLVSSRTQQEVQVNVQRQQESEQSQNQQHQSYDGRNGHAQDGQERRRQQREHTSSEDFMQQLRLGLIPADGEF